MGLGTAGLATLACAQSQRYAQWHEHNRSSGDAEPEEMSPSDENLRSNAAQRWDSSDVVNGLLC
jgi:hypothetical protein